MAKESSTISVSTKPAATQSVNRATVFRTSGAIIAFLIGSGFASGQEILQFFTVYGYKGIIGSLLALVLFSVVSAILVKYGFKNKNFEIPEAYRHYLGKVFGTFMNWYTPFFCFLIGIVMISGAGATMNQYFGVNPLVGTIGMTLLVLCTAMLGLNKLVDIISLLGPLTIAFTLFIALYTLVFNPGSFSTAENVLANAEALPFGAGSSSNFWFLGGALFVAYNIVAGVPFITTLGKDIKSKKEAIWSGAIAGIGLMGTALALNLAMLAHVGELLTVEVPVLYLAQLISPTVGFIFTFILLEEIFSTSAPMLWTVVDTVAPKKATKKTKNLLIVLVSVVTLIGAQLPFGTLVNLVYPFTGYFGIALIILVMVREAIDVKKEKSVKEAA